MRARYRVVGDALSADDRQGSGEVVLGDGSHLIGVREAGLGQAQRPFHQRDVQRQSVQLQPGVIEVEDSQGTVVVTETQENLTETMDGLVAHNVMTAEVEQAVRQVSRVLAMIDHIGDQDEARRQAIEYIGLAEGAIHVILRGSGTGAQFALEEPDIAGRWMGSYVSSKGPMEIQLTIAEVLGEHFAGEMYYPSEHDLRTTITGRVLSAGEPGFADADGCPKLEWREHGSHAKALPRNK